MSQLSLPFLHRAAGAAPVVLRMGVGLIMAVHGWQKLTEMTPAGFGATMLAGLGVPAPELVGWIVTLVELVGGVLLLMGLVTRVAALGVGAVLVGAIVLVKLDVGLIAPMGSPLPGGELDLALLAGSVAIALVGPGRPSVDHLLGIEPDRTVVIATRSSTSVTAG